MSPQQVRALSPLLGRHTGSWIKSRTGFDPESSQIIDSFIGFFLDSGFRRNECACEGAISARLKSVPG